MPGIFYETAWPGLVIWIALYVSDYAFTITCARMYRAQDKIIYEGSFELTPYYQRDIDSLRLVSPRFIVTLFLSSAFLLFIWWMFVPSGYWPDYYFFILGAAVLLELVVHVRHLRNYFLFSRCVVGDGMSGSIIYHRDVMLKLSASDLAVFAAFLGLLFLFTNSWFVLGGATTCAATAFKHYRLSGKHVKPVGDVA